MTIKSKGDAKEPGARSRPAADYQKQDLEAQQAMAWQARRMADLTLAQIVVGAFALAGLLATIYYSRTAAMAALEAAEAGKRQAKIAEDSFQRLERPYLFIVIEAVHKLSRVESNEKPHISYALANYGKTPAIFKSIFLELRPFANLEFLDDGTPRIAMGAPRKHWYQVLAPSTITGERDIEVLDSIKAQPIPPDVPLALHGSLEYEDPMKTLYTYHFVLLRRDGRFCMEYSKDRTEYPKPRSAA